MVPRVPSVESFGPIKPYEPGSRVSLMKALLLVNRALTHLSSFRPVGVLSLDVPVTQRSFGRIEI